MNPSHASNDLRNLAHLLERRLQLAPGKHFLFSEFDGRSFTYAEFHEAVNRAASMLSLHGIGKGDVVSLLMPNGAEYIIAYFACWKLGALAGPINSLLKADEIAYVISNSEAKALLVHSDFLPAIGRIRAELPLLKSVIPFDNEAHATRDVSDAKIAASRSTVSINRDDEAIIIYTSGTTGKPKGCLLTHGNVIANAKQISEWLGFTEHDRLLTVMPLFHMNAVSVTTVSALYAGVQPLLVQSFQLHGSGKLSPTIR